MASRNRCNAEVRLNRCSEAKLGAKLQADFKCLDRFIIREKSTNQGIRAPTEMWNQTRVQERPVPCDNLRNYLEEEAKTNSSLRLIQGRLDANITELFLTLLEVYSRSQLEVHNVGPILFPKVVNLLYQVQEWAKKWAIELKLKSHENRLQHLRLFSLNHRRVRWSDHSIQHINYTKSLQDECISRTSSRRSSRQPSENCTSKNEHSGEFPPFLIRSCSHSECRSSRIAHSHISG